MYKNLQFVRKILLTRQIWARVPAMPAMLHGSTIGRYAQTDRSPSSASAPTSGGNTNSPVDGSSGSSSSRNVRGGTVETNVDDKAREDTPESSTPTTESSKIVGRGGAQIAPIDIDAWADWDEDDPKEGTVHSKDSIDIGPDYDDPNEYPPIPEVRAGEYQFKGIKVKLPPKMLGVGTYRYCLDKEDEGMADDMRVCRYERP